jgi:type II secretory pathway component PulF
MDLMPTKVWKPRARLRDIAMFARQFTTMFEAGVNVVDALHFYAKGEPGVMSKVIDQCAYKVESGWKLSAALSTYPTIFSPVFVGLVNAGEHSGELGPLMTKLSDLLERQDSFQRRTQSALTYPIFLMGVCMTVGLIFMFFILPALTPMLSSMGVRPPLPTRMLLTLADLLRSKLFGFCMLLLLVAVLVAAPILNNQLNANPGVRLRISKFWLSLYLVGRVTRQIILARVLFTLATCLDTGLSVTAAIEMARAVASNAWASDELRKVRLELEDGENLSDAFGRHGFFPRGLCQMVKVGEETSSLPAVVRYCAALYEEVADSAIQTTVALFEPIMMGCMGVVAGFLVIASILPIVQMIQNL